MMISPVSGKYVDTIMYMRDHGLSRKRRRGMRGQRGALWRFCFISASIYYLAEMDQNKAKQIKRTGTRTGGYKVIY